MSEKDLKPDLEETEEYENCLDLLDVSIEETTLEGFVEIENKQEDLNDWKRFWVGMPEYIQEKEMEYKRIMVHFMSEDDYNQFAELLGQKLTDRTKAIWFPSKDKDQNSLNRWIEEN